LINKAVILAAGLSSRLYPLTLDIPKVLLKVNGTELIKRSITILQENGINDIAIVTGYKRELVMEALGKGVTYLANPFYKHCNNMGSLWFARNFVDNQPFIYLHGDIIYHEDILSSSYAHFKEHNNDLELVTDFSSIDEEAMKVRLTEDNYLVESNKEIPLDEAQGEWTGIAYIRCPEITFNYIEKVLFEESLVYYDTFAFSRMAGDGMKICCTSTEDLPWVEIDFQKDYERAGELFQ